MDSDKPIELPIGKKIKKLKTLQNISSHVIPDSIQNVQVRTIEDTLREIMHLLMI